MRVHDLLGLGLLLVAATAQAGNVAIAAFETNVAHLDRAANFYTGVLQFTAERRTSDSAGRTMALRLGEETLLLVQPDAPVGAAPPNLKSNDRRFQHIAIVVSDMDAAYQRLLSAHATIVSAGPQTLPASNFDAAGIRALYFRDPDGHFLELIQYPPDKGEPKWQRGGGGQLFLGIDHTAIVVRDVEASLRYFRDTLGLTLTGRSLNDGAEQDALNGLQNSKVKIASLRGGKGPGIELLQYLQPDVANDGAVSPLAANDTLRWQIDVSAPRAHQPDGMTGFDPDGHALHFKAATVSGLAFAAEALHQHWPRYLMEGAQLGIFMVVTLYLTLALEHPASPLRRALPSDLLRRMLMGVGIGGTVIALIYSDWGRLSGAQFNPSVTLAFLSLGRIEPWDAFFYVLAQFAGGWLGLAIATLPVRKAAARDQVNHVLTLPGEKGVAAAFTAEFGIAFLLMFSLLNVFHQPALKPWVGVIAGLHLWTFIAFEAPLSGMSLNPARSAASAFVASNFSHLWIYFAAPPLAMLAAAQLCRHLIDA